MKVKRLIIHPAGKIESAAAFTHEVDGVHEADLKRLVKATREFFKSFESIAIKDLADSNLQTLMNAHGLSVPDLLSKYCRTLKDLK